ncbi:unnamed protein product [Rangifer tarandus platyrhynchus]|uniref:Uncharacterized protein n=1 Tax=Rangifer tarandus platyrhynchus TaxID=3082113 RepID=A0AC59YF76_RANTA
MTPKPVLVVPTCAVSSSLDSRRLWQRHLKSHLPLRVEAGPAQRQESRNLPVCQPGEPRDSSAGLEAAAETGQGAYRASPRDRPGFRAALGCAVAWRPAGALVSLPGEL